ncbi:MAG: hypothetical protein Q4A03_09805 [Rothia sp. (in: high G+C Gram-positive bacteria)]|uniref:hypothetical protein n=1 Tax=Rothia sp. (in: high G+C Gram-positive bacteria) TaxID=1885016 RepID=UPI0026F71DE9|nr:hypothetical protein [Rothia sp. (in: high G+C Gram-positive bacteria)]
MRNKILKAVAGASLVLAAAFGAGTAAEAATVYYKNSAVSWDYGRSLGVNSYSKVQSGTYDHSATANTTFSGWKKPGVLASAVQFVGTQQATAYWNCRG